MADSDRDQDRAAHHLRVMAAIDVTARRAGDDDDVRHGDRHEDELDESRHMAVDHGQQHGQDGIAADNGLDDRDRAAGHALVEPERGRHQRDPGKDHQQDRVECPDHGRLLDQHPAGQQQRAHPQHAQQRAVMADGAAGEAGDEIGRTPADRGASAPEVRASSSVSTGAERVSRWRRGAGAIRCRRPAVGAGRNADGW